MRPLQANLIGNGMPYDNARRQEFRGRIVAAALRCFAEDGYTETAIQAVCREAETTSGTFYNYFNGKLDLLFEAAAQVISHDNARFDGILEDVRRREVKVSSLDMRGIAELVGIRKPR